MSTIASAAPTVVVDAAEWDRVREVLDAARDWQEQMPPPGEACPDCGSAGEPGTERRLDDAVKRLWSNDGGARSAGPADGVLAAARAVVDHHGTPGATARIRALNGALNAVGPDLTVVVAAARWTDRYGRAGAGDALGALVDAVNSGAR